MPFEATFRVATPIAVMLWNLGPVWRFQASGFKVEGLEARSLRYGSSQLRVSSLFRLQAIPSFP